MSPHANCDRAIKSRHKEGDSKSFFPSCGRLMRRMVSLSDHQLEIVTTAANAVPVERRSVFLERRGAMLRMRWQIQRFI
ncbi:MAG: hypothetical protein WCE27_23420, partial [Pseudolabrys sp.]